MGFYDEPHIIEESKKGSISYKDAVAYVKKFGKDEYALGKVWAKALTDGVSAKEFIDTRYKHGGGAKNIINMAAFAGVCTALGIPAPVTGVAVATGWATNSFVDGMNYQKHGKIHANEGYDLASSISDAIDNDPDLRLSILSEATEDELQAINEVKKTKAGKKLKEKLKDKKKKTKKSKKDKKLAGEMDDDSDDTKIEDDDKEVEEEYNAFLLEAAKKSKKKAKKKAKEKGKDDKDDDKSKSDDDSKSSSKDDKDSDSGDDDISIDDIGDSVPPSDKDDSKSDKKDKKDKDDSDSDDKDSKSSKKKKDKDKDSDSDSSDDDLDSESIEDKAGKKGKSKSKSKDKDEDDSDSKKDKDSDDDAKDDKKSDKKDKKKDKDSESDDLSTDDLKIEHFDVYSSNHREVVPVEVLVEQEFDIIYDKMYQPKMSIPKKRGYLEATKLRLRPDFEYPEKSPAFNKMVREFFDISDHNTRKILVSVDEEDQNMVLHSLTDKLYDIIVNKAQTIDYGPIPDTKGEFEKMPNYPKLRECVKVIHDILVQYKQDTDPVDEIDVAMDNLINRTDMFRKCYMSNVEFGIFTYQTIAMAVIASTSLMISASIDFIKNPENETYRASIDRVGYNKAKNHLLFDNLKRFNIICKDKSFDRAMDNIIRESGKNFLGMSTMAGFGVAALVAIVLFNILPILRECTYFFYYTRTRISDYFNIQADLLDMSIENIRNGAPTQGNPKDVIKRQEAIRDRFRKVADFFMVESKKAELETQKEIRNTEKKYTADEVIDDVPDSTKSALF